MYLLSLFVDIFSDDKIDRSTLFEGGEPLFAYCVLAWPRENISLEVFITVVLVQYCTVVLFPQFLVEG